MSLFYGRCSVGLETKGDHLRQSEKVLSGVTPTSFVASVTTSEVISEISFEGSF